ncbi:hypothetical protein CB1_001512025, partial [Camelus ferus]
CHSNIYLDLMAKRKEENFFSPENAKRPRQEELDDFDKDGDEDECTVSFTNGTSTLTAAEVGIIESIQLRNFMCHSMLGPFKFGSNVNFVVGNNGSGKSAVLTALIVGLGGKAIATNRGSSLKGFVKDGQKRFTSEFDLRTTSVNEIEKQLNAIRDNIKIGEDRAARLERKTEEQQVRLNEAEKKYKDIQDKLEKISQETHARAPECMALKADVTSKKKAYNEAEVLFKRSLNEYKALKKDDEQLCKRIEELRKREEELDVKHTLNYNQKQLKELKDSKTDRLKRFGPHVPALLEAIDDAYGQGHFTYKPIGPLGACIHLRDPELALAIESCLKGLLQAYCCHNHADERVLQALMKKFYLPGTSRPQIIVSEFRNEVYDVRHRAAYHPEFPTVLTALEIDNAVVANSLIDMRGIETVLLIKEDEAQENKIKMKMVEKNMEQQKENMEHLESLKIEAENKYDAIKQKINQLSELADPLKDMVNRRIAMDMILKMADSQRFRQFILLTPQSMSSLPSSKLIRILRMSDPERGQTTLPFRPVSQEEEEDRS